MNIYVGNLSASTTEEEVKAAFENYGAVNSTKIIKDFETGVSRGFGFVDMSQNDGAKAIEGLNGSDLNGNAITVNEAYERRNNNRSSNYGYNRNQNNNRRY